MDQPGNDEADGIVFLLALEAIPFLALAAASDEMPWWLALAAAGAFGLWTVTGVQSIFASNSSTAAIALPIVPAAALLAVPCLVAACDVVALVRMRAAGGAVEPPSRREIALAVALGGLGFLAFLWFGLFAGMLTALAVWAHRVRPHPLART